MNFLNKQTRDELVLSMLRKGASKVAEEVKARRVWTLSIPGDDPIFTDVGLWLTDQESISSPRRALAAKTIQKYNGREWKNSLRFLFDSDMANRIDIDGHEISVVLHNAGNPTSGSDTEMARVLKPPKLVFSAKTRAGRDAVVKTLQSIHDAKQRSNNKPALRIMGKWDDWIKRDDLPPRTLDSVITKGSLAEELYEDIKAFRDQEEEYARRAIPFHRAFLLSGPPGTGKTSAVRAVAYEAGMDLWYCQLSEIAKDSKLLDVLSEVKPGGILLLEDVDAYSAAVNRDQKGSKLTTSGLLNVLDGVVTPHGLITILTANHPEKLDKALVRPGRIDRILEFEHPDSATIHRHFEFFYGKPAMHEGSWPEGKSSSQISEIFKRNMNDPARAEKELLHG